MKTMTCRELEGPCDQKLYANSWPEMVQTMTAHVLEKHPQTAKEMARMHEENPQQWSNDTKPKWDAIPEDKRQSDNAVAM